MHDVRANAYAFLDRIIVCSDCGNEFTFTSAEQALYAEYGFSLEPLRCPACLGIHKVDGSTRYHSGDHTPQYERAMHPVICRSCGKETLVSFAPRHGKPVYCPDCFQNPGSIYNPW